MAVTREIKDKALAKASSIFSDSKSAVFVHFSGLEGNVVKDMRAEMKKEGVDYTVAKKTLIKKAAGESSVKGDIPVLEGEIALAYSSTDETAAARLVKEFAGKTGGSVEIVGGVFEGEFKTKEQMNEIANIPSMDVLRGMFVNILNSPIQRTAIVLSEIAKSKA
jgi:large subunit ribosomal protein L10